MVFLFDIQLFICVSWFEDETAASPSLPPPDAHRECARWDRGAGSAPAACCAGMLLVVQDGENEVSAFGIPNSLGGSHSGHSSAASTLLHHPPHLLPLVSLWVFVGDPWAVAHKCQGPAFLGRQQRGTAHGLCTQGPGREGRGPGALSGYNLGTINRGSKGSRFLFSFYPLQCLC